MTFDARCPSRRFLRKPLPHRRPETTMDLLFAISTPIKVLFVIGLILQAVPIMLWAERRQSAKMQDRVGPTRADLPLPPFVLQFRPLVKAGALLVGIAVFIAGLGIVVDQLASSDGLFRIEWGVLAMVVGLGHIGIWRIFDLLIPENGKITLFGLLHSVADAMKLIWKEDFVPPNADKLMHSAAPFISVVPALITMAVVPFSDIFYPSLWLQHVPASGVVASTVQGTALQVASLNVGILYIFGVAGTGIVGAALAGYSSDNKFSLLGGIRAASQMVSYEVTLGLSIVGCFMVYGSLLLEDMVHWQQAHVWGIFIQPLAFFLFFAASTAESKRIPFDIPEGESEIVAGYFTEYAGMKFAMFMMGEYAEVILSSVLIITLFLGGYNLPFLDRGGFTFGFGDTVWWSAPLQHWAVTVIQVVTFLAKLLGILFLQFTIRWSLPRFRYDQLMKLCWQFLLPLSLLNIFVTGIIILLISGN